LLTHTPRARAGRQHRADDYTCLLSAFPADASAVPPPRQADVRLTLPAAAAVSGAAPASSAPLLLNFNSEAPARRMPVAKAAALIQAVRRAAPGRPLGLIGAPREAEQAAAIIAMLPDAVRTQVHNLAGQTNLTGLLSVLHAAPLLLTTDSGPAHVANALGTPLVVCFGPGDETSTGPYHPARAVVMRAPGPVPCAGCTNICKFGDTPPCLLNLDEVALEMAVRQLLRRT
jgi:ADP-heptose:LPS heptosyltransferase